MITTYVIRWAKEVVVFNFGGDLVWILMEITKSEQ